jgi:hypothetical protein
MCAGSHGLADGVEMKLHGMSVGERHHQGRTGAARRADGPEQIG